MEHVDAKSRRRPPPDVGQSATQGGCRAPEDRRFFLYVYSTRLSYVYCPRPARTARHTSTPPGRPTSTSPARRSRPNYVYSPAPGARALSSPRRPSTTLDLPRARKETDLAWAACVGGAVGLGRARAVPPVGQAPAVRPTTGSAGSYPLVSPAGLLGLGPDTPTAPSAASALGWGGGPREGGGGGRAPRLTPLAFRFQDPTLRTATLRGEP